MKQPFSYELKQNVTADFFKKYFHGEEDEKSISYKYCFDIITCALLFKINNSFAIKNDKISHSENFNYASHLKFSRLQT